MSTIIPRLATRLTFINPNAQWSFKENDYDTLEWKGPGDVPTAGELNAISDGDLNDRENEEKAKELNNTKALKAIVLATADRLGVARNTFAQEVKAIYKGLL